MPLILETNYSKKIGLAGYRSHQFTVTLHTSSRILTGGSVHYEQVANWRPVGLARRDKRTRKRLFSASAVAGEALANKSQQTTPKM